MITFILIFFAGVFKAFSDKLKVWDSSIWWNLPKDNWFYKWAASGSWLIKWKLKDGKPIPNTKRLWYYLWLYKPDNKERFFYSSTFLVMFTDGWHTGQFLMRSAFMFAVIFYKPILILEPVWLTQYIFMTVCYMIGFTLFYDLILKKR